MTDIRKTARIAGSAFILGGILTFGVPHVNQCVDDLAHNEFQKLKTTTEGREIIRKTLSELEAKKNKSADDVIRIATLKYNSSATQEIVPVSALCKYNLLLWESVDDAVDEFLTGYERI